MEWDGIQGTWPENVTYEVYRGQDEGFVPSADNLVASNLNIEIQGAVSIF